MCPRCLTFWAVQEVKPNRKRKYTIHAWDDPVNGLAAHLRTGACQPVAKREKKVYVDSNQVKYSIKQSEIKRFKSLAKLVSLLRL